jgi:hypothetical protein
MYASVSSGSDGRGITVRLTMRGFGSSTAAILAAAELPEQVLAKTENGALHVEVTLKMNGEGIETLERAVQAIIEAERVITEARNEITSRVSDMLRERGIDVQH